MVRIVLHADHTVELELASDAALEVVDIFRVLVDLSLEGSELRAVLFLELLKDRLVADARPPFCIAFATMDAIS